MTLTNKLMKDQKAFLQLWSPFASAGPQQGEQVGSLLCAALASRDPICTHARGRWHLFSGRTATCVHVCGHTCLAKLAQKLLRAAGHVGVSSAAQTCSVTGTARVLKSVTGTAT